MQGVCRECFRTSKEIQMRITCLTISILLLCGCSSTRVLNHDFSTVVSGIEDNYSMCFLKERERTYYGKFPLDYDRIEVKKYKPFKKVKLEYSSFESLLLLQKASVSIKKKNETQTKVKVRAKELFLLMPIFWTRNKGFEEIMIDFIDELSEKSNAGT